MIDEDIEVPTISRQVQSSGLSFAISVVVHLSIFLVLALILTTGRSNGIITLNLDSVENNDDLYNEEVKMIELSEPETSIEISDEQLEQTMDLEEAVESAAPPEIDWSALEPVTLDQAIGEFSMEQVGEVADKKTGGSGFFGIEPTGNKIVYILDMSPSMEYGYQVRRYDRAVNEVLKSVNQLRPDQEFLVFLFCFRMFVMDIEGPGEFCLPTDANKAALEQWLATVRLQAGTDPREAIVTALQKKPSCCYLLSDGEFNGRRYRNNRIFNNRTTAVQLARENNHDYCPIHTIGLEDRGSQKAMTTIAKDSGGTYKFVPALDK